MMLPLCSLQPLLILATASLARAAIEWSQCTDPLPGPSPSILQCSTLVVPLDYTTNTTNNTLTLQLVRIPAQASPSKGSILFNFGGPGPPARAPLAAAGALLLALTGGQYDLVAFDPRGTANTLPFSCYDQLGLLQFSAEPLTSNHSDVALGQIWARGELDAQTCLRAAGERGGLVGTAFVARDMIKVVDALEEDGMLRYWGTSYGTTLGATVAAMFPERVDKLILDGVQNPHEYYHATADFEEWEDSDKVVSGIFETCFDYPENCALAAEDATPESLERQFYELLARVRSQPIIVGRFKLTYDMLKQIAAAALYETVFWPPLSVLLQGLFQGEATPSMEKVIASIWPTTMEATLAQYKIVSALEGIHCSDRTPRLDSLEEFIPTVQRLYDTSKFMGDVSVSLHAACAQWPFEAKERYQGNFQVETANPILLIGNHFDSHTPLKSAYNVSSGFESSRVLEIAGYGHGSLAIPSLCLAEKVSAYFNEGILPEHGHVCNASFTPYSGKGWTDLITPQGSASKRAINGEGELGFELPRSYSPGRPSFHW